ncbi:MAG: phosphoenolpyruvate synthase [Chloroflexi bacterium]|nr:phosphoenolpyruvate synthase [Chloroflexota bacterium]
MAVTKSAVRWFKDVGKENLAEAGGKGANLGEMTRHGIPVPPGFVVTAGAYFDFIGQAGLRSLIREATQGLDVHNSAALEKAAERIKSAILSAKMPVDIVEEVREAYRQLGGGYVAVRSSATAEDLPDASFAGQQSTFLNILGEEEVVQAVKACWASLFEARAIFYRQENKFDHLSVGIAVPVQRMVESEVSGVMFTAEPISSDTSKLFIEAVYGLGEAIVSGQVTPDTYLIDKATAKVEKSSVAPQDWMLARSVNGRGPEGANHRVAIPRDKVRAPKLDEALVHKLVALGKHLEAHYKHPQDIEWATERGNVYILQTRPITTLKQGAAKPASAGFDAPILVKGAPACPGVGAGKVVILEGPHEIDKVKKGDVLVADMTTPDYVPAMKRAAAIITNKGGRTCHAAIVSRELGVPCIVGAEGATGLLKPGQDVTVDATNGKVYAGILHFETQQIATVGKYTKTRTKLYVNLADPARAEQIAAMNVDGVGLLRAEFIAAHIGEHPHYMLDQGKGQEFTDKLAKGIRAFAKAFYPRPVTYRTTDFKTNEYRNLKGGKQYEDEEENPMIGFRGCFRHLADEAVFRLETDAIKKVEQEFDNLNVMIPFVRTPNELRQIKKVLADHKVAKGKLWIMVEIPATVILLDQFLDEGVDGISIGSNDLTQLVLGVDRDNAKYAELFDERNEAVLWCLEKIIGTCRRRGITASICGQAPSFYPDLTAKLVDWGITSVSVSPDMIVRTRDIIGEVEERMKILPPQS